MLFSKRIDKSLLTEGLNIPVSVHNELYNRIGVFLSKGESRYIKVCFKDIIYSVLLRNIGINNNNRSADMVHIRYTYMHPFAIALRSMFGEQEPGNDTLVYVYISRNKEYDLLFSDKEVVVNTDTSIDSLKIGDIIDNNRLCQTFKCSPQGGMRRSLVTNTLVLVSHYNGPYGDRWSGDILHYTGMGLTGDQSLSSSQNKTLNESITNGVVIHLFEVIVEKEYTYRGKVSLISEPYQENQTDPEGNPRSVWIFPLKLHSPAINADVLNKRAAAEAKKARASTIDVLEKKANEAFHLPSKRISEIEQFERNQYVSQYAKVRAKGHCQLCNQAAPFTDKDGEPYLECHHIIWLSNKGEDTVNNVVALCPNCHRKMHILNLSDDIQILRDIVRDRDIEMADNSCL